MGIQHKECRTVKQRPTFSATFGLVSRFVLESLELLSYTRNNDIRIYAKYRIWGRYNQVYNKRGSSCGLRQQNCSKGRKTDLRCFLQSQNPFSKFVFLPSDLKLQHLVKILFGHHRKINAEVVTSWFQFSAKCFYDTG